VRKVSEGVRVDQLRRDSSFAILWEQTQEKVRTGQELWSRDFFKEEESTASSRREDSRKPADHQISVKLRGV
jgi:hypothetical protein